MKEIVLDLYGGDRNMIDMLPGAWAALCSDEELNITLVVKNEDREMINEVIDQGLSSFFGDRNRVKLIGADDVFDNNDNPMKAASPGASYTVTKAMEYMKGRDDACFITVGNTAATLILALTRIGLKEGFTKPALSVMLPRYGSGKDSLFCLLDCGANLTLSPQEMLDFGRIGAECVTGSLKVADPKVALLSVGKEAEKGTKTIKEAHKLLEESELNFIGNVEPDDILSGDADVIVCDGFAGNMILKNIEATGNYVRSVHERILESMSKTELNSIIKNAWDEAENYYSFNERGGAILLGVRANIIKAHGKANADTIASCIELGKKLIG